MSNFKILVIGNRPKQQLLKYKQNRKKELVFFDKTDIVTNEYNTKKIDEFFSSSLSASGVKIEKNAFKEIKSKENYKEFFVDEKIFSEQLVTNKYYKCYYRRSFVWIKVQKIIKNKNIIKIIKVKNPQKIKVKCLYNNLHDFATTYHNYKIHNEMYGVFINKNAKWGTYVKNGKKFFILKGTHSECNQSLKKNIDFFYMIKSYIDILNKNYNTFIELYKKTDKEHILELYYNFDIKNISEDVFSFVPEGRKEYIKRNLNNQINVIVFNGKWIDLDQETETINYVFELLKKVPNNTMLSVYECNI